MEQKIIQRQIMPEIAKYMDSRQVIVLTGMRRVGKTSVMRHFYKQLQTSNKVFLDLEDALVRDIFTLKSYEDVARSLEERGIDLTKKASRAYVFLDEVQFSPNLPSIVKYLYDKYNIKFFLSGSSSYYIKNHFTESLAGRKYIFELYPLTFREFLDFKEVKKVIPEGEDTLSQLSANKRKVHESAYKELYSQYIRYGGFPEVVLAARQEEKKKRLHDIINSYFQKDVTTFADFEDIAKLRDLLKLLTQRVGQRLNIDVLANALKISRKKVYQYLELLKMTYVIDLLAQKSSLDNSVSSAKKVYFRDTGLANILGSIAEGSQLENSVYMNLVGRHELSYYQTSSGGEIDFVLNEEVGLEVKNTATKRDVANLKKRANSAGIEEYYVVSNTFTDLDKAIMAWDL
ncbi:AAA family ATPase [candidate division WWE3 bacterium]|nr:AAA family ATPase [candidate division WWE3 bacterium]